MSTEIVKHTPGPWRPVPSFAFAWDFVVVAGSGQAVANALRLTRCDDPTQIAITKANADLISAAPDLLAALKRAVESIRAWHNMSHDSGVDEFLWQIYQESPEMAQINAAIAKAEPASQHPADLDARRI